MIHGIFALKFPVPHKVPRLMTMNPAQPHILNVAIIKKKSYFLFDCAIVLKNE
jgi:hypothetical protein